MLDIDMMNKFPSSIFIKDVLLEDRVTNIRIQGDRICDIGPDLNSSKDDILIDGKQKAAIPGLVNCHTHAAMTYFRGYGDDRDLMDWLENMIWPVEAHLSPEDIYWGSRLACIEMIKSGTTAFLDMYTYPEATAQAVVDSGLRATLSYTMFDRGDPVRAKLDRDNCEKYFRLFQELPQRVQFAVGPHAIYTVSGEQLKFAHSFALEHDCPVNLHLAETLVEWKDCVSEFGTTPVRYLHRLGVLSPKLILAHSLWMDSEEIQLLADHGCSVVHNPASNMKLASGYRFRYREFLQKGVKVGLGTDGCSSSNNLDMITSMKLASLLAKAWTADPKEMKAEEIFHTATVSGSEILGIDAGRIEKGAKADIVLVDLSLPEMVPLHSFVSNLVYSANGSCVTDVIVDGVVLMQDRQISQEKDCLYKAQEISEKLLQKAGRKN